MMAEPNSKLTSIFHVASMARSGETLMLRTLNEHSRLSVVHNLYAKDTQKEAELFLFLQKHAPSSISSDCPVIQGRDLGANDGLVLKQAVWEHEFDFCGFILARNPVSIYASLLTHSNSWSSIESKLVRWAKKIDQDLAHRLPKLSPIQQVAAFYNRRMVHLFHLGKPIVHFETFVESPESTLKKIMYSWRLPFEHRMLNAQESYQPNELGHGNICLSKPISTTPNQKYKKIVTQNEFAELAELTRPCTELYGYDMNWNEVAVKNSFASRWEGNESHDPKNDSAQKVTIGNRMLDDANRTLAEVSSMEQARKAINHLPTPKQVNRYPDLFANQALQTVVDHCDFETVLDIGSGAGDHSQAFADAGKQVTAIDFGCSIYFQQKTTNLTEIKADYYKHEFDKPFDLVWASHVLEHQPNPNLFLQKVHQDLREGGWLAVTVPPLKHQIVGGHLTLWNAGLLLYNLVFAGFDCREAAVKKYGYNISIVVKKRSIAQLPELHYDSGDIDRLQAYFPSGLNERFNGNLSHLNWNWRVA